MTFGLYSHPVIPGSSWPAMGVGQWYWGLQLGPNHPWLQVGQADRGHSLVSSWGLARHLAVM